MKRLFMIIFGVLVAAGLPTRAATVVDFFTRSDADIILPHTDKDARLDALAYYVAGMPGKARVTDVDGSIITITAIGDSLMTVSTRSLTIDIALFTSGKDSLIVVSRTYDLSPLDSRIEVYDTSLRPIKGAFVEPSYSQWLTDDGRRQEARTLAANVPFIPASATLNPSKGTIQLNNNALKIDGNDAFFRPTLEYVLRKGKFELARPDKR